MTLDTMLLGFRPHDIDTVYLPFIHGLGTQVGFLRISFASQCSTTLKVGLSDPVFMAMNKQQPTHEYPPFPYDPAHDDKLFFDGDEAMKYKVHMGSQWMKQVNSGLFKTWEDVKFLRDSWEGPLVLKGIQRVEVRSVSNGFLLA